MGEPVIFTSDTVRFSTVSVAPPPASLVCVPPPLACVVVKQGETVTEEEILEHLKPLVAKWWLPDAIEFVDAIPHGATGKISKKDLRDQFRDYKLADA